MMQGKLYIDGVDAFSTYGLFVEQGGYKEVVQLPPFKQLDSTEWAEYDGVEVDLSAPVLDARTLNIPFCITDVRLAYSLFEALSKGAYHYFDFREIGVVKKLRLTANSSFVQKVAIGKLTLTFVEDQPEMPTSRATSSGSLNQTGYSMNGVGLEEFKVWVRDGTDANIRKASSVREELKRQSKYSAGVDYFDQRVRFKAKDITLKLLIHTDSIKEFWQRWECFFYELLKPNVRTFWFNCVKTEYTAYYKSCNVQKFEVLSNGHVWCEFSVVINATSSSGKDRLLSTEDDRDLTSERGKYFEEG